MPYKIGGDNNFVCRSITLNSPATGQRILKAVMDVGGAIVDMTNGGYLNIGAVSGYSSEDWIVGVVQKRGGPVVYDIHPNELYMVVVLSHCNWAGGKFQIYDSDSEASAAKALALAREKLIAALGITFN